MAKGETAPAPVIVSKRKITEQPYFRRAVPVAILDPALFLQILALVPVVPVDRHFSP